MTVRKLYQEDAYINEWNAKITSVEPAGENKFVVKLSETAFFPEGGGQSCDTGNMTIEGHVYEVTAVKEDGQEVLHTIEGSRSPACGAEVSCTLDWDHRFDNMQRHCGEHILSGICFDLFGGVNRGFHMGHDSMTIDISLEKKPEITEITYEMAMEAELAANRVIWSDAPVTVMRFSSRKEAENLPLRKALAFDEDISIVCVGSADNASDCVACCGTHPASAGQVGLIKIFKVEKYKGMFRIFFEAGQRALMACRKRHDILYALSNKYSSSIDDFPAKLKASQDKMAAAKNKLHHVTAALIARESADLDAKLAAALSPVVVHRLAVLEMEDVFNMAKGYMADDARAFSESEAKLIMLYAEADASFVLVSNGDPACGKLVKEYASFYNGKGGGSNTWARAIFAGEEDAMLFADLINKHLK